jgi:hypothetical protein
VEREKIKLEIEIKNLGLEDIERNNSHRINSQNSLRINN